MNAANQDRRGFLKSLAAMVVAPFVPIPVTPVQVSRDPWAPVLAGNLATSAYKFGGYMPDWKDVLLNEWTLKPTES